jgi:hypothetical protein
MRRNIKHMVMFLAGLRVITLTSSVFAGAIVTDGKVKLGINTFGNLNNGDEGIDPVGGGTSLVGMRYLPGGGGGEYEATSHGCVCEGWGVAASGISGNANADDQGFDSASGLALVSFVSTATTATSVTTMGGKVKITHDFAISAATANLMEVKVTIEALADVTGVEYRRTMDWDTSPSPFTEIVDIGGWPATALLSSSNDGFCSSDPLSPIYCSSFGVPAGLVDINFADEPAGGADHGANFDFGFGDLLTGEIAEFSIFYGGADSKAEAFDVMAAAGVEVYSLARSFLDPDADGFADDGGSGCCSDPVLAGDPTPTYIFGFKGVGGTVVDPVPAPATLLIFTLGLIGLGALRGRRTA